MTKTTKLTDKIKLAAISSKANNVITVFVIVLFVERLPRRQCIILITYYILVA